MPNFDNPEEQKLYDETLASLQNNAELLKELDQYSETSVNGFLESYALDRVILSRMEPSYIEQEKEKAENWLDEAYHCFHLILQKKLFDLQCRWRSELITISEIQVSADFGSWEEDILNCPFLEPITRAELEQFKLYLQSDNPDLNNWFEWQNHEKFILGIKDPQDDEGAELPEWYEFHNNITGNHTLLLLPDIRGEKEKYYMNIAFSGKESSEDMVATNATTKPFLPYLINSEVLNKLAKKYDKAMYRLLQLRKNYMEADIEERNKYGLLQYFDLCYAVNWPIEANDDWYEGLKKCHAKYTAFKTLSILDEAYSQYLMQKQVGIPFNLPKSQHDDEYADFYRKSILKGRALLGEPQDFNF